MKSLDELRQFKIFDFDIEYGARPNSSVYTAIVPKELIIYVLVPARFDDLLFAAQCKILKPAVMINLEDAIMFDTPDAPYFTIDDVEFCFEAVH